MRAAKYRTYFRIVPGDINGFLGLIVDNVSVLALFAGILITGFGVPSEVVLGRMIPGTAVGVLFGDLLYSWLAMRLSARSGRRDVTALPFGVDTPSTIGMAVLVLGPAFAKYRLQGMDPSAAGIETWYLGMAATVVMGLIKLPLSFAGNLIRRWTPRAALLGSLAGTALLLIGFLPIIELFQAPIVGFLSLGLVLHSLVAKGEMPGKLPGVLFALLVGTGLFYGLGLLGFAGTALRLPELHAIGLLVPRPDTGIFRGFGGATAFLPLLIPFALLTVIGGINNTESARVAGDDYNVRDVLLAEAAATLLAGLCGGVSQTTPYIGHPAFKQMGARVAYTWMTGLCIGVCGMLGLLSNLLLLIPVVVLAPVLIFVALDITVQSFQSVPARHAIAVAFGFFPPIARMLTIELSDPAPIPQERFAQLMVTATDGVPKLAVVVALGNGFIITSMIWTAVLVKLIDRRLRSAAIFLVAGGTLSIFGVIHSVRLDAGMYCLWRLDGIPYETGLQFSVAYFSLAVALLALSLHAEMLEAPRVFGD